MNRVRHKLILLFILSQIILFNTFLDQIDIKETETTLESSSIWGMLRGLESLSQLLHISPDARSVI